MEFYFWGIIRETLWSRKVVRPDFQINFRKGPTGDGWPRRATGSATRGVGGNAEPGALSPSARSLGWPANPLVATAGPARKITVNCYDSSAGGRELFQDAGTRIPPSAPGGQGLCVSEFVREFVERFRTQRLRSQSVVSLGAVVPAPRTAGRLQLALGWGASLEPACPPGNPGAEGHPLSQKQSLDLSLVGSVLCEAL